MVVLRTGRSPSMPWQQAPGLHFSHPRPKREWPVPRPLDASLRRPHVSPCRGGTMGGTARRGGLRVGPQFAPSRRIAEAIRARSSGVEHLTFNQRVDGSIPSGLTKKINGFEEFLSRFRSRERLRANAWANGIGAGGPATDGKGGRDTQNAEKVGV